LDSLRLPASSQTYTKIIVALGELPRLQVPRQYLNQYIELMTKYVQLIPAELIYNLDETSLSDWKDSRPKPILVPMDLRDSMVHDSVNRQIQHQTIICCVSASGDAYCSLLASANELCPGILTRAFTMELTYASRSRTHRISRRNPSSHI
jgi:hypothetical protein